MAKLFSLNEEDWILAAISTEQLRWAQQFLCGWTLELKAS